MTWYYYVIIAIIAYPIITILAGNLYWHVFNSHMTVMSTSCDAWIASWMAIICQKRTTFLFNFLFYSLSEFDKKNGIGKEITIYDPHFLVERIIYHNPRWGYNKGRYVFAHMWLLPLKLIKLIIVAIITFAVTVVKIATSFVRFLIRCIAWLSKSDSQIAEIKNRTEAIAKGSIEEVVAKADPARFRVLNEAKALSASKRLKEIEVEIANLEIEKKALQEQIQEGVEPDAGARAYHQKASNGIA